MSRFSKIMLGVFATVILGSGAAVLYYRMHLEQLVVDAAGEALSTALGEAPTLKSIEFDPFAGHLELHALQLGNPPGFSDGAALDIGSVVADVDMNSLAGVRAEVGSLTLRDVHVRLQESSSGLINLQLIEDGISLRAQRDATGTSRPRRFAIADYHLINVSLEAVTMSGERYGLLLPDQHFTKLGYDSGGLVLADALLGVLQPVFSGAIARAVEEGLLPSRSGEAQTLRDLKRMIDAINSPPPSEATP